MYQARFTLTSMSASPDRPERFRIRDLSALADYVPGQRLPDALKLSSNEVTEAPLDGVAEAMAQACAQANRYPDMVSVELRTKLAEHLGLSFEHVAVGIGSSALCQQLVQLSCLPGDEVIFPWRSFEAYPIFVNVAGATPVPVPLDDALRNDLPAMADAINDRTRLIFVCNPNNPTGTVVTDESLRTFLDRVPSDIIVALDEAYIEYARHDSIPLATDIIRDYPNVVGLRTFSKAYGLAGVRVGYAFGDPQIITALNKVAIPFGVNVAAQAGAIASLEAQPQLLQRTNTVVAQRDRVADHLGTAHSQANFVWLPTNNPATSTEIARLLTQAHILVRAFPEGIRITVTNQQEMDRLLNAWDGLPPQLLADVTQGSTDQ